MLLHTPVYLIFLLIVIATYWGLPARHNWRKYFLLAASYFFYAWFDLRFAGLLIVVTLVTYWIGAMIPHSPHPRRYMWSSVVFNLSILGVFKYANFFLDNLRVIGNLQLSSLALLLPIGISFYTFQAISYTTEIYRQRANPAETLLDYAVYLAFFPKLIAGPLVRPSQFLNQLENSDASFSSASFNLLLIGLFKKIVIADILASQAEVAFRAADLATSGAVFPSPLYIQGFYLYAFLIYADFSGYTDIARASAALLGFQLPENFQQPYLSSNVVQFWNRWHMTMTQWFREYLFYPLSRRWLITTQRKRTRLVQTGATLVTMILIGLWHGAAWTFVAWGTWHGILLSSENLLNLKPTGRWQTWVGGILAFHLVGVGWVLFRSTSFASSWSFIQGIFAFNQMGWLVYYLPSILVTGGLVFTIDLFGSGQLQDIQRRVQPFRHALTIAILVLLAGLMVLDFARGGDARPFIYGNF